MLTVHKCWDLLKDKLAKLDYGGVEKRIGPDKTIVFEIENLKYDPKITIIEDKKIKKWLAARQGSPLPASPPPKQFKAGPSRSKASSSIGDATPTITTNNTSSKTKSRKLLVKSRPKIKRPQRDPSPQPCFLTSESSSPPPPPAKPTSSKAQTSPPHGKSLLNLSEEDESCASNNTEDSVRTTTAVCVGSIDALVLNERIDDEYAKYEDDDDFEVETEMSRNLKKIRTPKPPPPPPKPTFLTPSNNIQRDHNRRASKSPPPRPKTPPKPLEPDWPETQKQLQQNHFINVFKDFDYFKIHLASNNEARNLLKEATLKCFQEDESSVLLDMLSLLYENNFNDDIKFWSEIVLRLKRKLNSHTHIKTFKSKTNSEWVYENYKRVAVSISEYAKSVNQTFELPFHAMKFIIDPHNNCDQTTDINQVTMPPSSIPRVKDSVPMVPSVMGSGCTTTAPSSQNETGSSSQMNGKEANAGKFKLEPLPPLTKFNLMLPDIKPKVKCEKQENINPAIKRKITLIKNAHGQTCFKILRRKSGKIPVFKHRL